MLTDTRIRSFKPGPKPYKKSDSGGLYLLVAPAGTKAWKLAYRYGGKQRILTFSPPYPATTLRDARARRDDAKRLLSEGIDPGVARKEEKRAAAAAIAGSFRIVAEEWFEKRQLKENRSARTLERARWLCRILNDGIGDRPIDGIEAPEILGLLRAVEARGHHETVHRLRSSASRIFRYGIATGRCERDPAADLRGAFTAGSSTPRPALVDPDAVGALMRAIDAFDGNAVTRAAMRFLALVFCRPGELRFAEWSEFDLEGGTWSIPAIKMKMQKPHRVPLSPQAIHVLRILPATGRYVFAISGDTPPSENIINIALRRMGYATQDEMTAHGFRALASTLLNEMRLWHPDVIEAALAHREPNNSRRAYNRAVYWVERVAMMTHWANYLDELRGRGQIVRLDTKRVRL